MKISSKEIPEVLVFEPTVYPDDRGYFMETFRASHFLENDLSAEFVQENQSRSVKGTLRGLHYQLEFPQGKLARVVSGEIFDVADLVRKVRRHLGIGLAKYYLLKIRNNFDTARICAWISSLE